MAVTAGTRLGSYDVVAPIAAGGMGEVYRAHDSRLGRDVALKVLPADLATDTERRRRFEQEARAASGLNHPNVVHVYDIGGTDGTIYIAMELVEGRTLRELVQSGPLPSRSCTTSPSRSPTVLPARTRPASFTGTSSPRT
jgi:eukaryotic-like serine/threonine-protein kinase